MGSNMSLMLRANSYYLLNSPDVAVNDVYGTRPFKHWLEYGCGEGRK